MSSTTGVSNSSNMLRMTGLATGLDTDATVKQLMKAYQTKLDKLKQDQEKTQWRQDLYRDILSDIKTFKSSYLDFVNPAKNMLSRSTYSGFDTTITDAVTGNASNSVSITPGTDAVSGNYKIENVTLAKAATMSSDNRLMAGGVAATSSTMLTDIGMSASTGSIYITYNNNDGSGDQVANILIDPTKTLGDLANAINEQTSNGVVARFSELTGKFTIQASDKGQNTSISIENATVDEVDFLNSLQISNLNVTGSNFSAKITAPDGSFDTVTKSTNAFTIDEVAYSFNNNTNVNFSITQNTNKSFDKIKEFIDKYNEFIEKASNKIEEKTSSKYPPLTEDQKSAMSKDEITAWETKAKQGLLRNDSMLSGMLDSMRSAFYQAVEGVGLKISDIGLSTSGDYSQRGKILIDETKLKAALKNNGTQVVDLFTKISTSEPTYNPSDTNADREARKSEEGIFQRINDVLMDYTRTTRNSSGKKGLLVEKAGITGDLSEYSNVLTKDLNDKQKFIETWITKMATKENQYYTQFAKLESAMNSMNAQSSWLSQQLGTSSN